MKRIRAILLGIAIAALAVGTLALPVAAANPLLAVVNGIPGRTVEVCIGNSEVRSRLGYGRWFQLRVNPGDRAVRFRAAAPGNCNGTLLAQRTLTGLVADQDLTVVGTARAPRVVVFDNLQGAELPVGPSAWRAIRHAADVGNVVITEEEVGYEDPEPAATPVQWEKGDQEIESTGIEGASIIAAARPGKVTPFEGPNQYNFLDGRRTEIILVGTTVRNARFVVIDRPTLAP